MEYTVSISNGDSHIEITQVDNTLEVLTAYLLGGLEFDEDKLYEALEKVKESAK